MGKLARWGSAVLVAAAAPALGAAPALAQQYPGTTSTTTTAPAVAVVTQAAATVGLGEQLTVTSCGFAAAPLATTLNGRPGPSETVDADGCARTAVAVLNVNLVRVEGVQLAASCGTGANTLTVSGPGTTGSSRVVSTSFGVECPDELLLPRTGALVVRWSLLGGALAGVGTLLVLANRRPAHP